MKKTKVVLGVLLSICIACITSKNAIGVLRVDAQNNLDVARQCTFVIPSDFEPGTDAGTFVNKSYPMESSSISYNVYSNGDDVVLTNRERLQQGEAIKEAVVDKSGDLTKSKYQELLSDSYNLAYGEDVGFKVESFDNVTIDGYPGYKIVSSYQASGEETVHQTVYMILSRYKTFTITYQRAEDDDCAEQFESSAETIHVS